MAKKPKNSENSSPSHAIQSLFSPDNPFRRQPQPDSPPPEAELGLGLGSNPSSIVRKRKLEEDPELILEKRKKMPESCDEGAVENPSRKRRKRKREEIDEYERRKLEVSGKQLGEKDRDERKVVAVGEKRKASDLLLEMLVSKEEDAFDEEEKLLRTVFVGNLPLKIKKKALMKEFGKFGEIYSVRIRSVPLVDSKIPRKGAIIKGKINDAVERVHSYIVFEDEQSARAALSHNMAEVGGNHIRVDMACPPRKKLKGATQLYDRKRTVFVGNLPFDVKDEELYRLFSTTSESDSNVEAVRVIRDPVTSLGKGIAYVLFKTRDAADTVVKQRDLKLHDRVLRLCHAKSDATPSKLPSKRKSLRAKQTFTHKKLASNPDDTSPGSWEKPKAKAASLSYQGVRARKLGVLKKSLLHPHAEEHAGHGVKRAGGTDQKIRKAKWPAVAARKAKLQKRKLEGGTPENTHHSKKARNR